MKSAMVMVTIAIAMAAGVFAARYEADGAPRTRAAWARLIAYWVLTIPVAFEMAAGSVWDLLRIEYTRVILTHLGYPLYLESIMGWWKLPCALALLAPRFPRLKEWAYAGAFFNYMGAAASHLAVRDPVSVVAPPVALMVLTFASWALRPASRRSCGIMPLGATRAITWWVPAAIVAAMLVVAFLTVPQGAPKL
jgi:hypothetical protein